MIKINKKNKLGKGDLSSRRRKRRSFKVWFKILFVLLIIVGGVFLVRVKAFQIKTITVSGLKSVSEEEIKKFAARELTGNYLWVIPKTSVFLYPQSNILSSLRDTFPKLDALKLQASIIDQTLYIETAEKVAVALWCSSECYLMDASGTVFAPLGSSPTLGLLRYEGLIQGNPVNKKFSEDFVSLEKFVAEIQSLGLSVEKIKIIDADSAEVHLQNSFVIKFVPRDTLAPDLFENIKIFITNLKSKNNGTLPPLSYIDARYGNKIFYK